MEASDRTLGPMQYTDNWFGKKKFQFECVFPLQMLEPKERGVICIHPWSHLPPVPVYIASDLTCMEQGHYDMSI